MEEFRIDNGAVTIAGDRRGEGPPFVLVHGFTGSRLDWTDVADDLARDVEVVSYDNRGHGESSNTGDEATYSFDTLTSDLVAVVDGLGLDQIHLLGHSLGGGIAMRYAIAHPDRLRSLVLMDTAAAPMNDEATRPMFEAGIELVRAQGLDALYDVIAPAMGDGERADEIRRRIRTKYDQMDPAAFCALGTALLSYESMLAGLASLDVPTTVIVGEHDAGLRAGADQLAETIRNSVLVVVEGAGHSPQEEQPAEWLRAVRAHVARAATLAG